MTGKNLLKIFIALVISYSSAFAQPDSITIKMMLSGKPGQTIVVPLEFGIKKGATDGYDKALGEKDIYPGYPPSGLGGRFAFYDTIMDLNIYSYRDFRGFESTTQFTKTYDLGIAPGPVRQGDKDDSYKDFYIRWQPLSQYIDSARIQDLVTGNIINISLKDSTEALYTNENIENLRITVHFNMSPEPESVEDFKTNNQDAVLSIYPNPAQDKLFIHSDNITKYSIISVTGQTVLSGEALPLKPIDLNNLPAGVYAIVITTDTDKKIQRFIKQ
ncbi:MAG: T9SS type A sorting domain-containing protein [Bacteroidota bacterium]